MDFAEMWSWFSRLVFFNWVRNIAITNFISENNLWKHGKLEVLMHVKSILWYAAKYAVLYIKIWIESKYIIQMYFPIKLLLNIHYAFVQE